MNLKIQTAVECGRSYYKALEIKPCNVVTQKHFQISGKITSTKERLAIFDRDNAIDSEINFMHLGRIKNSI